MTARPLALLLCVCAPLTLHAADPGPAPAPAAPTAMPHATHAPEEAAWEKATLYLFKESYQDFRPLDSREARLGRAALLLLQQPKTDANLDQAVSELEQLASSSPATASSSAAAASAPADESAISARYLLGRIAHVHRPAADLPTASGHYRRLIAEHPGHLLAGQALIKLAIIEIHQSGLAREELPARIDRFAAQADALPHTSSRRDLHLVLAAACSQLQLDDERALRHYLAAHQAGVVNPILRANITVAVGELAHRLDRPALAREYFERYLAEFARDYRRTLVKEKLADLPATPATPRSEAPR